MFGEQTVFSASIFRLVRLYSLLSILTLVNGMAAGLQISVPSTCAWLILMLFLLSLLQCRIRQLQWVMLQWPMQILQHHALHSKRQQVSLLMISHSKKE